MKKCHNFWRNQRWKTKFWSNTKLSKTINLNWKTIFTNLHFCLKCKFLVKKPAWELSFMQSTFCYHKKLCYKFQFALMVDIHLIVQKELIFIFKIFDSIQKFSKTEVLKMKKCHNLWRNQRWETKHRSNTKLLKTINLNWKTIFTNLHSCLKCKFLENKPSWETSFMHSTFYYHKKSCYKFQFALMVGTHLTEQKELFFFLNFRRVSKLLYSSCKNKKVP